MNAMSMSKLCWLSKSRKLNFIMSYHNLIWILLISSARNISQILNSSFLSAMSSCYSNSGCPFLCSNSAVLGKFEWFLWIISSLGPFPRKSLSLPKNEGGVLLLLHVQLVLLSVLISLRCKMLLHSSWIMTNILLRSPCKAFYAKIFCCSIGVGSFDIMKIDFRGLKFFVAIMNFSGGINFFSKGVNSFFL